MEHKSSLLFEVERDSTQEAPPVDITTYDDPMESERVLVVRLDKWLWAARCFKTLALARAAIEQGKVYYDGQQTIPSKEIKVGANLVIQQGKHKKILIIKRLLTRRRSIDESNPLFEELGVLEGHDDTEYRPRLQQQGLHLNSDTRRPRRTSRFLRRSMGEMGDMHHNDTKKVS